MFFLFFLDKFYYGLLGRNFPHTNQRRGIDQVTNVGPPPLPTLPLDCWWPVAFVIGPQGRATTKSKKDQMNTL